MLRYFLVTYNTPFGFGNICLTGQRFPSQEFVKNYVSKHTGAEIVIVVHVFEFKNEQDFEDFQRVV
ncbi:MAG: hypothetical protein H7Y04_06655 [Verrucomicrobia bacterium]|nr:hypothetical protein [Cytophagales bacterium]